MTAELSVRVALQRWKIAREHLASFEASYLTLLLVAVESDTSVPAPLVEESVLAAWRDAEAEAHAAYTDLLTALNSTSPALA